MPWKRVTVKDGDRELYAMRKRNIVEVENNELIIGPTLNVDGKDLRVLTSQVILCGDMVRVEIAEASPKKEKVDAKQTTG